MNSYWKTDWLNIRTWPPVRALRRMNFDRKFLAATDMNYFSGLYTSFEEASAAVPKSRPTGYDNPGSAGMYTDIAKPLVRDYPAMFWLEKSFRDGATRVFDLGGHFGFKYYSFAPLMDFPAGLDWTVCDVAAVAAQGRQEAIRRGAQERLHFTTEVTDLDGFDVLHAAGSLQYLPYLIDDVLSGLAHKPQRLILNATALHPTRSYFTVNSIGTAFCPYRVQKKSELFSRLTGLGYEIRDRWTFPKDLTIPNAPAEFSLTEYTGAVFDLKR